jgi:hypothetical protein
MQFSTPWCLMVGQTMNWPTPNSTVSCRVIHYMYMPNSDFPSCTYSQDGRAIVQGISHRLPTTVAWVWSQVKSCGICGGQSGTGAGCLQTLQFPLPVLIPPNTPCVSIIWGWCNSHSLADIPDVPSGLSLVTPPMKLKKWKLLTQGGVCSAHWLSYVVSWPWWNAFIHYASV